MKKVIIGSLLLLLALTGCGKDQVQEDLLTYMNKDIKPLASLEEKAIKDYESVTGGNYKDDETLHEELQDVIIPEYKDFVEKLEAIKVDNSEISKIHEGYIKAANEQQSGFVTILDAIEKQDTGLIAQANDKLAKGREGMRKYQQDLNNLAKEHNVKIGE
ncbi:hypothetical protein [Bacillus cereus]|uniref:hypothetical protein n=1 Tax=Bacillus cereus TaxID=1396 RepID=UPI000BF62F44|nr:hypothetical protein [Bacillus cereus]PEX94109.1 hypothetical protein CN450_01705 [Bacillus cereus]